MTARRRGSVLGGLVVGAGLLLVSGGPWVVAATSSAVDADVPLTVTGGVGAPGVTAGAIVVLAASLALALVGRWGRWFACAALALGGALAVAAAVAVATDPGPVAISAARELVGVGSLSGAATITPLPWVAVALGLASIVVGLRAAVTGRRWDGPSARHEPVPPTVPPTVLDAQRSAADDHAAWDALSRGEDPT